MNKPNQESSDTIVIIPALNEQESIELVLRSLQSSIDAHRFIEIIVVDNGSNDRTAEIARHCGVLVLHEPKRGYGQACLTGMSKAYEIGSDIILFLDADFSDNPMEFSKLLKSIDQGNDLVVGSRMLGKAEPGSLLPQAYFGNKLATFLLSKLFGGFRFTDLGPFRAIRMDAIKALGMTDKNFGWTVEMQIKAILHGLNCAEISVSYKKRVGISKITGTLIGTVMASYKILFSIFYYYIKNLFTKKQ